MRRSRTPRILHVFPDGTAVWMGRKFPCLLGRSGIVTDKLEGDGGTPVGLFPLRSLLVHPHRRPVRGQLASRPIGPKDGWCDDPGHASYNRSVRLPLAASHECLRRADTLYDLVIALGQNDRPPRPGGGSAIFLHIASPKGEATEGCVAFLRPDLEVLIGAFRRGDAVRVHATGGVRRLTPRQGLRRSGSCVRVPRNRTV